MSGFRVEARYHVPRNQCYEGSRGGTRANVHLHVIGQLDSGRLHRKSGDGLSLCGRYPWYHREPEIFERSADLRCPRCLDVAHRHGITWPESTDPTRGPDA
jgi:hypothetical protein